MSASLHAHNCGVLLSLLLVACGASEAGDVDADAAAATVSPDESRLDAKGRPEDGVLGTIEAMIDGERAEFFVVSGEIRGDPYAAAVWYETDESRILLGIGGLDTPSPDLDSFQRGAGGMPVSFGDYEGPVLSIMLDLEADPRPISLGIPADENSSTIAYMPVATLDDLNLMYLAATGLLELTAVELSGGKMSARGSFSGTVRSMGSGEVIEITDGTFEVDGIPHLDDVKPRG